MLTHLHEQLCPQDRPTWGISLSSSFPGPAHVGHLALFLLPWTGPRGAPRSLPPSLDRPMWGISLSSSFPDSIREM